MKAIILAAGKSTRTFPLTEDMPKSLLKVANKTILEHNLEQLSGLVDEIIIVVGYKKKKIIGLMRSKRHPFRFRFVEQKSQLGTGHALLQAEPFVNDRFILLMGDNIYLKDDIKRCMEKKSAILVKEVKNPQDFGIVEMEKNLLKRIVEKPDKPKSNLANAALYVLSPEIFSAIKKLKKTSRGEIEVTDAVKKLHVVMATKCFFVTYPWDLLSVNEELLKELDSSRIESEVEEGATIKGVVVVGKGTIVRAGAYVEGPVMIGNGCRIGPNCYIRPYTSIGDNCKVGNGCEIKNSVLMDSVSIGHLSYFGDSVIGFNTNIGAGTITANLRHDNGNVNSVVKGVLVDSGRRKLGAMIGSDVHTGIHTSIFPGRKIFSGKSTLPGEVVREDIE
ncbi:NTP transferase domain-containing protein [Candidatus Woesearchaeota archaeon]|nr:NTP transferase domain-containing protein [Candidatus Woesearchaeota archaeon]